VDSCLIFWHCNLIPPINQLAASGKKRGKNIFGSAPAAATAAPFTMAQLQSIGHGNIIASAAGQQYEVSFIVRCVVLSIFPLFFANILSHLLAYISGTILIAVFVCCIGSTSSSHGNSKTAYCSV
jgi:hypothetical protein